MYLQHLGLRQWPFGRNPDQGFLYPAQSHIAVLDALRTHLGRGAGPVAVIGAPGAGKATVVNRLLLDIPGDTAVARLTEGPATPITLLQSLLLQFGYTPYHLTQSELSSALYTFLLERERSGQRSLIVIEAAQHLSDDNYRQLTDLITPATRGLDLLLSGDGDLADRLNRLDAERGAPLCTLRLTLALLHVTEVGRYLQHRLDAAGAGGRALLDDGATALIQRISGGLPKVINQLADSALQHASREQRVVAGVEDVLAASRLLGSTESRTSGTASTDTDGPSDDSTAVTPALTDALPERGTPAAATPRAITPSHGPLRLRVLSGESIVSTVTLWVGEFQIGRTRDNDLQIESRYVSRRHCRLLVSESRVILEDLRSTNGIDVNGYPVRRCELRLGDRIRIGLHTLTLEQSA